MAAYAIGSKTSDEMGIIQIKGTIDMGNTEQTSLVAEHIKKMTYRELYDLAETLHGAVKSWEDDDDAVRPDDFAETLLGWAESVPSDEK